VRNVSVAGSLELVEHAGSAMDNPDTLFLVALLAVAIILAIGKLIDWIVRRFPNRARHHD
jgi:hypothetical protein